MELVTRQRVRPRIYDFCYFTCKNNLAGIKYAKAFAEKNGGKIKILDVGCGVKPFKELFPEAEYIGIDFTKKETAADYVVDLNTDKIPFKDNSFDLVIVSEAMEHVFNNLHMVREIKRVAKKKGYLFISTPFIFHQHSYPHDYYRFTESYYKKMFEDMDLLKYSGSNSIFSSPLMAANVLFEILPWPLHILIAVNNAVIYLAEAVSRIVEKSFSKNPRILRYIKGSPTGYYFVFRKTR
jgi:ubiquinone/menaquinone biosynthesis C-methylase UbiE